MSLERDDLIAELGRLEATGATPEFTERVMGRLAARRRARGRRRALIAGGTMAVIVVIALGVLGDRPPASTPSAAELVDEARRLRQDYLQLERDLESLRASAEETAPVLYLGGTDDVDLVLDLVPFVLQPTPAATPVAADGYDPYEL